MAGDWIKMRVWISRDPKVIEMADWLAEQRAFMDWLTDPVRQSCKETAYEHVTRNVTVALCVTGLLHVWGTARERGDRVDDDLILKHCSCHTLAALADIPLFGLAMAWVDWAEDIEGNAVCFRNFFKENESPEEKHKRQNAERQARHREKQSRESNVANNVTNNVTVTHREEKRRDITPIVPKGFAAFWDAYPARRRTAKAPCLKAWAKDDLESVADQIVLHVEAMKLTPDWTKEDGKYIPMASTYLNQRRFEDGFPEPPKKRLVV